MAALGRLIDELRAGGELDSRGEFTLDRDRAREKMRQFQLADPRSYVLELVQAAVLAGAGEARFEIDADDMRMSFDGRPFTARDFEELYSSMFTRRSSLARRQLALGLNSAMALDPRVLRVESGTARMEMRPDGDEITTAKGAVDGTRIHVKDRFGNATLVRFVLKLRGHVTEMLYLKEHCRWAALAIHLNGQRISGGEPLAEAAGRVELTTPGTSIVAGFAHEHRPARLMILDQGVWIATHQLDHLPLGFVACVECARLLKDASQRDVVRDEAYDGVLEAVSAAFYRALAKLSAAEGVARHVIDRRIAIGASGERLFRRRLLHPATLPLIRRAIDAILESGDGLLAAAGDGLLAAAGDGLLAADGDGLLAAVGDETPEGRAVSAVPLWPSARHPPLDLSLLDLLHLRTSRGRVGWTDEVYPDLERQDQPPVAVISAPEERNYLAELFGDGFYCADSELQHELARWRNVLRWRRRRMTPEIPASAGSLISMPLATAEVQGEVGIFLDPFRQSEGPGRFPAWWIKDGGLLQKAVVRPIVRGFTAALEADFEPAEDFTRVEVDRLFVRVVIAVARALGPLMNRLAAESRRFPGLPELIRGCLISYLGIDWHRDGLADHLRGFGITGEEHLSYARRLVEQAPVTAISAADLAGEEAPALARLPLFATLRGPRLSLRDVARGGESWRYLPRPHTGPRSSAEENVLLLDDGEIAVLRQVFPGVTLRDHSRAYHYEAAYARHMRQQPVFLRSSCVEEVVLEAGAIRGRFGLRYPESPGTPVYARLQLLKHDRRLDEVRYRLPIGPIAGMINDDELIPTADWSGVEHDGAVEQIRSLVLERIAGLLVDLCDSHRAATGRAATGRAPEGRPPAGRPPKGHRRRLLLNAATRVLATEAALKDWSACDLLPPEVTDRDWAVKLAGALETVPLFKDLDGRPVDLRSIRRDLDRHDTLLYLLEHRGVADTSPQEVRSLAGGRAVLRLSRDDHDALARIFGSYRLSDARQWLLTGRWGPELDAPEPAGRAELSDGEVPVEVAPVGEGPREQLENTDRQRQEALQPQQAIAPALPEGPPDTAPVAPKTPVWDGLSSREARLLQTLHAELRRAGRGHVQLLDDKNLDRIVLGNLQDAVIASCRASGVTVNRRQPLVERLLAESAADPVQMAFLASAVYTAMNHFWQEIEDDHERDFHRALIKGLLGARPRSGDARA